jgi:cell division protein FtsW
VAGAPGRTFSGLGLGTAGLVGMLAVVEPYRLRRLASFRHPFDHASTSGYQAVHGIYALASGGWFGVGLGASREKWAYLPNAYTDYIFAIIGEELGLLGTLAVLTLFAFLGYAGIRIAVRSTDRFVQIAAAGVTAWLLCQAMVNIGSVLGLLPVTGIPLPLVSFGGSALVPTLVALGMLLSFARREPGAAQALAARRRGPISRAGARMLAALPQPHRSGRPATRRGRTGPSARAGARRDRARAASRGPRRSR